MVTHLQIASIWIDVSLREEHTSSAQLARHPIESGADVVDHVRLSPDQIVMEGVVTNQPIELPGSHADGATTDESGFTLQRKAGDGPIDMMRHDGTVTVPIEGEPSLGFLGLLPGVDQAASLLRTAGRDVRGKRKLEMLVPKMKLGSSQKHAVALRFSKPMDRVKAVHDALRATFEARRPVQIVTGLRVYESVVLVDLSIMRDASNSGALHFGATGEVVRIVKSETAEVGGAPDPAEVRATPVVDKGAQTTAPVEPGEVSSRDRNSIGVQAVEYGRKLLGR